MALTETSIKRAIDVSGDEIKSFLDAANRAIQAMAVVDEAGDHVEIATERTALNNYTLAFAYNEVGDLLYFGRALVGASKAAAVWQIKKFLYDINENLVDVLWADGNENFDNIWNNVTDLSYS